MNDHERDRIAAAVNQLRPDWPIKSLRTLLDGQHLRDRPRRDVAVALTWVACEAATETPARVLEAGPWWKAANVEDSIAPRPPRAGEHCRTCGKRLTATCCDNPTKRPPSRTTPPAGWRETKEDDG